MKPRLQYFFIALVLSFSVKLLAFDFALSTYELLNAKCPPQNTKTGASQTLQSCKLGSSQEERTRLLKAEGGELAENAFLASLASERSDLMSCAEKQISEIEKDPISLNKFADDYAAKLTMLAYDKRQMQVLLPAIASSKKASEDYSKLRQHSERILASMSYAEISPMRMLINRYLNELDQFRPEGMQAWFAKQMKDDILSAIPKAKAKITQDRSILQKGAETMAKSLSTRDRESLAQDSDLIEGFRKTHPDLETSLKPTACMVDAKYGKGAKERDDALMIASFFLTPAAKGIGLAARGVMTSVTGAAAVGSISSKIAPILRVIANEAPTAAIASLNVTQAVNSCTSHLNVNASRQKSCAHIIESVEEINCMLNVGMGAMSVASLVQPIGGGAFKLIQKINSEVKMEAAALKGQSKTEQLLARDGLSKADLSREKSFALQGEPLAKERTIVAKNAALKDSDRVLKIEKDFKNLSKSQAECVLQKAHAIGAKSGIYNYSRQEIFQKARVMRNVCQIPVEDIDALIRLGYAGKVPAGEGAAMSTGESDFAKLLSRPKAQAVEPSNEPSLSELKSAYEKTPSLLEKVKLEEQINHAEQQQIAEELQKNPKILDELMRKDIKSSAEREVVQIGETNRAIRLSPAKTEQILKGGTSELEALTLTISKGDQVGIKSASFGERYGKIVRSDPENPDHLFVETMQDGKLRTVSIPQTELMLSDQEKSKFLAEMMKQPSQDFKKLLERGASQDDKVKVLVDDIVKQATMSPQKVRINEIEAKIAELDRRPAGIMSDQRQKLANELHDLTSMSVEDRRVIKALRLIDVNQTKPPQEYPELIAKAKKILAKYDQTQLKSKDQDLVRLDLASLEKKLAEAPKRAIGRDAIALRELNGSQSFGRLNSFPSRTELVEKLKLQSFDLSNYRSVEQLFKEDPELLSSESRDWLNRRGRSLLNELEKKNIDSKEGQTFKKRLELYIHIDQLKNL